MKVFEAKTLGFCMGVKRAIDSALKEAEKASGATVYSFGPLIHNPQALDWLKTYGVVVLSESSLIDAELLKSLGGKTVIIRAHGATVEQKKVLESCGAIVVDATCPRVLKSQNEARKFYSDGVPVILVGDKNHGEILGIASCAKGAFIVGNAEEAAKIPQLEKAAVIAQTTIKQEEYDSVCAELKNRVTHLQIINSICAATRERQEALVELCGIVEAVIVVGGKDSANTQRLLRSALDLGKKAWLIETANELPPEIIEFDTVGVTAGASTPDFVVKEVISALNKPKDSNNEVN